MRFTNLLSVHPLHMRMSTQQPRARQQYMRADVGPGCILAVDGGYATQQECLTATSCGWKYKCNGSGVCFQAPDGTFSTQAACLQTCATKWACDGSGSCVPNINGAYATQADCKCYSCQSGACKPVAVNTTGAYGTLNDCIIDPTAQCGWNYKCASVADGGAPDTLTLKVPSTMGQYATPAAAKCVSAMGAAGPSCVCGYNPAVTGDAAFNNITQCSTDATAQCGWKYGCSPAQPNTVSIAAGDSRSVIPGTGGKTLDAIMASQGGTSCTALSGGYVGCSYGKTGFGVSSGGTFTGNGKYLFFPMIVFTATKPVVKLTTSGVQGGTGGGGGNVYTETDVVLIPWGNYDGLRPDPTSQLVLPPSGYTSRSTQPATGKEINAGAIILKSAGSPQMVSGDGTCNVVGSFNATAVGAAQGLQVGWQYALAVRIFYAFWDSGGAMHYVNAKWVSAKIELVDA